jgi:hypothetical protein
MMQMGWSRDDLADAMDALGRRGLVMDHQLTEEGQRVREAIEHATDAQERSMVEALGDDADELLELLDPWARRIATNVMQG